MNEQTLKKLADPGEPLAHRLLRSLSNLYGADVKEVKDVWPSIAEQRREQMASALVEMAEDDVEMDFIDIFRFMLSDPDAKVRASAVSGLWESDDQSLINPLITLMSSDPAPQVRAVAAETLGQFALMAAEERVRATKAERLLDALCRTSNNEADPLNTEEVRRNALESLAYFSGDDRVTAAILKAHASPSVALRAAAVAAMGFCQDEAWQDTILSELLNPEPEIRYEAARAAGEQEMERAVSLLVPMTKDRDSEVQLMAITALGEIGGMQAKACLTQLLESNDDALRDAAEEALEELQFTEDPLDLKGILGSPGPGKSSN